MALVEVAAGTQTATVTTEHTLATLTGGKTYVLVVDTANMVGGATPDILELRIKTKVRSGNASQLAYSATYVGAQGELNKYSVPVPANIEFVATLTQAQGAAGRDFIWSILSLD